jgi:hypothetical protein
VRELLVTGRATCGELFELLEELHGRGLANNYEGADAALYAAQESEVERVARGKSAGPTKTKRIAQVNARTHFA